MDVTLPAGGEFQQALKGSHNAFIHVIEWHVVVESNGLDNNTQSVKEKRLAVLSTDEKIYMVGGNQGARFLLIAGRKINEPVVRSGPFVMNTRAQIRQAFTDFNEGRF
jgi:redox-sensitive bicupin YhaK (pirin superfamily)